MAALLETTLENVRALDDAWLPLGLCGGIFVQGDYPLPTGAEIKLRIIFNNEVVMIPGVVRWARRGGADHLPGGLGIEFTPNDTRSELALLHLARQRIKKKRWVESDVDGRRRERRVLTQIDCEYMLFGFRVRKHTVNVSPRGALIATDIPPDIGSVLPVRLWKPDTPPITMQARVVRHTDHPVPGIGVALDSSAPDESGRWNRLLAGLGS